MTKCFPYLIFVVSLGLHAADIGMIETVRIEIPGARVEAIRVDERAPAIARVEMVEATSDGHIYEIDFVGLEPGTYDVIDYLQTVTGERPPAESRIIAVERKLAQDFSGEIITLPRRVRMPVAWYSLTLFCLVAVWILCLPLLLFITRTRSEPEPEPVPPLPTLSERLRQLLDEIGRDDSKEAWQQLEATLIRYLVDSRGVSEGKAFEELVALKADAVAGPVIREFEQFLHAPGGRRRESLDTILAACSRVLEARTT